MPYRSRSKEELGRLDRLNAREAAAMLGVSPATLSIYQRSGVIPPRRGREQRPGRGGRRYFTMLDMFGAAILRTLRVTCGLKSTRTEAAALAALRSGDPDRLARFLIVEIDAAFADEHHIPLLATGGRGDRYAVLEHATDANLRVLDAMHANGVVRGVTPLALIVAEMDDKLDELIRKGRVVFEKE